LAFGKTLGRARAQGGECRLLPPGLARIAQSHRRAPDAASKATPGRAGHLVFRRRTGRGSN